MVIINLNMDELQLSHELRIPLVGIRGFAELLTKSNLPDPDKEKLTFIKEASDRLLIIINQILSSTVNVTGARKNLHAARIIKKNHRCLKSKASVGKQYSLAI